MASNIKIGIISPFDEPNYGTVLQAYALQKKLNDNGVYSEYLRLNYSTIPLWKVIIAQVVSFFKHAIFNQLAKNAIDDYSFFSTKHFKPIIKGYKAFVNKRVIHSKRVYTPSSLYISSNYNCFLIGSDQTWSEARCSIKHPYYLSDVPINSKKYAYAPSIGTTDISPQYLKKLLCGIKDFDLLSCREKCNSELLTKQLGRTVNHVVDPTLLLGPEEWNEIAAMNYLPPQNYVLCYILGEKDVVSEFAEQLGKVNKVPVYYIVTRPKYINKEHTLYPTPEEFLSLIRDAAYVVTDSFHGTIFSVNYGASFYSFSKREGDINNVDNARIVEFLSLIHLDNRFINDSAINNITFTPIDYSSVRPILRSLKDKSLNYISDIIRDSKS